MPDVKYEIVSRIAILSETSKWKKELNVVSWYGREAKYDLRNWSKEEGKGNKGLTLTNEELKNLREVLNNIDID